MKAFHFPLDRVLVFRRLELELAESHFKKQAAALDELDRRHAELEAEGIRTEIQVREWKPVSGGDLAALGSFRLRIRIDERDLTARRAACREELAKREAAMLEARRRLRHLCGTRNWNASLRLAHRAPDVAGDQVINPSHRNQANRQHEPRPQIRRAIKKKVI